MHIGTACLLLMNRVDTTSTVLYIRDKLNAISVVENVYIYIYIYILCTKLVSQLGVRHADIAGSAGTDAVPIENVYIYIHSPHQVSISTRSSPCRHRG